MNKLINFLINKMSQDTIVLFEVLDFQQNLLIKKIKLKIAEIYIDVNNKSPTAKVINFPKNADDYYVEKIELLSGKKIERYFRFRIYKNRINCHHIFLNKLNNFSFEISYFNKNIEKLPHKLDIKIKEDNYNLKPICQTDLPFINSFGIINCDKAIMINKRQEIFLDEYEKGSFNVNFVGSMENYTMNIIKIYKKYYPKLIKHEQLNNGLSFSINIIKEKLKDKNISKSDFSILLTTNIQFVKSLYLEDYLYYIANKMYPLDEEDYSLLLNYVTYLIMKKANEHTESFPILKAFFDLLIKLENKMKDKIINQRDILSFAYYFLEHYCTAKNYKYCLDKKLKSFKDLYDTSSAEWLDFDIVFIKECRAECAYNKAVKLLENVLEGLKPNSKLLEILYLLDSGSGKIKSNDNFDDSKISFNLSMITKENIISHIKNLSPNMIIRKDIAGNENGERYAECDIYSGIMTVYETTLFKKDLLETKKLLIDMPDENDKYTMTIFMCLLHEVCSHLKLIIKEKTLKSPNIINDPYDDYNELELESAESGRVMEYYINKDINKIKFLKFSFSPKKDLYNSSLWTDENFEKLNIIIENLMENSEIPEDYLNYEIRSFPKKRIKDNKKIPESEEKNEIDWEYSSHMESEDEEFLRNKSDIKNNSFEENEKFHHFEFLDIKPIVKY